MSNPKKIIDKTEKIIELLFKRVALVEPYYTLLRELQADIHFYKTREQSARKMRKKGASIRQIAKALGFKHPGSVTHLLNDLKSNNKKLNWKIDDN